MPAEITVSLAKITSLAALEREWRDLEPRADGSFFTSWLWIGAWLAALDAERGLDRVWVALARKNGSVVGLATLCGTDVGDVARRLCRGGIAFLNQSGDPALDAIYIEYNGLLADRALTTEVQDAMLARIAPGQRGTLASHTLIMSGVGFDTLSRVNALGIRYRLNQKRTCRWIDLASLANEPRSVLQTLSRNTRHQLQRALRLAAETGAVVVQSAHDRKQCDAYLADLKDLHVRSWERRANHKGAFSHPFFTRFLDELTAPAGGQAAPWGGVDVLRIAAGTSTIGILVNFVYRGHVYNYLSGFDFEDDNRRKPGLVCHVVAADHYRSQGMAGYHFMAGDARYKTSLGASTEELYWLSLRANDPLSKAQDLLWRVLNWAKRRTR